MKIFYLLLCLVFLISVVNAEQESLGTFKIHQCVAVKQTCSNCTYVNITSIMNPDSTQAVGLKEMTKVGTEYNYTFCSPGQSGKYIVNGKGDPDGINTVFAYDFNVTPSGLNNTLGFDIVVLFIGLFFVVLGFFIKDGWITMFGSFVLILVGLYVLLNGIDIIRDLNTTRGVSLIIIMIGSYIGIRSGMEMINDDDD